MARRRSRALSILTLLGLLMTFAAFSAEPAQTAVQDPLVSATVAPVDPLDDPWLSEDGPVVTKPLVLPREQVAARWRDAPDKVHARAGALLRTRLELGLGDLLAPATVIGSVEIAEDPALYSGMARDLAPGVPSVQIAHAMALWRSGDIGAAIGSLGATGWAIAVSLEAQLWLFENMALLLLVVILSASLVFVLLAAIQVFPHAAHDLGDLLSGRMPTFARFAALAALLVVPLMLGEGLLGLTLALFTVGFAYGGPRQRNALLMSAVLLIIGLYPLAQVAATATHLFDRDPVAQSVMSVLAGTESATDVERLEAAFDTDLAAAHALVYRARRNGLEEVSRERMESLIARYPNDAVTLGNLGNIEKRRGNNAGAIEFYERASGHILSPTLLFNLSQAYATAFRMEEYESTLVHAQRLGDREVAALSNLDDAELVADLAYPIGLIHDRLLRLALSEQDESGSIAALAPGRLGEAWYITSGAFALVALFSMLFAHRWDHSSQCGRCGHRICTRCEETVWSEEICEDCHHLFQNPEATDASLRMARLQALSERESRFDKVWLALSLVVPGMAGFAARRPDFAMFGLLLFSWVAAWIAWPTGVFADPMLMGGAAVLTFAIPGILAVLAYTALVFVSLIVRKSR